MNDKLDSDPPIAVLIAKWAIGHAPTDKELEQILPTLPLDQRIELILRKYVGGATSKEYDGETPSNVADARIAAYLMRKLKRWLPNNAAESALRAVPPRQEQDLPPSLQASLDLFREDPEAWHAEWQRMHDFKVKLLEDNAALRAVRSPQGDEHEVSEMRDEGHPRHRTIRGDDLLVPQVQEDRQAAGNRLGAVRSPHQQEIQESETRVDGVPEGEHGDLPRRPEGDT